MSGKIVHSTSPEDVVDEVARRIGGFCTNSQSRGWWNAHGAVIRQTVASYGPATPKEAGDLMSALTKYWAWAWAQGFRDITTALDPAHVERFIADQVQGTSQRTSRNQLRRLGRTLNPSIAWGPPQQPCGPSLAAAPYTEGEVAAHLRGANATRRPQVQLTYQLAIALTVGAGATTNTIKVVTPEHFTSDGDVLWLDDPNRARPIPIVGRWAELLAEIAAATAEETPLLGPASRINNHLSRCKPSGDGEAFRAARGRSTWIVKMLDSGLPLDLAVDVAGVATPSGLDGYLGYMQPTPDAVHRLVRGAGQVEGA